MSLRRYDPKRNNTKILRCCAAPEDNVFYPLKNLLILALRLEIVHETSLPLVLDQARARNDKIIQRINGDEPVFGAIDEHSMFLVPWKPALNQQVNTSIAEASKVAGVLGSTTSHNMHRERAKDIAQMTHDLKGIDHVGCRQFLCHRYKTLDEGTTEEYTGSDDFNYWSARRVGPLP